MEPQKLTEMMLITKYVQTPYCERQADRERERESVCVYVCVCVCVCTVDRRVTFLGH